MSNTVVFDVLIGVLFYLDVILFSLALRQLDFHSGLRLKHR
jgi:hypothetical protein